MTTLPPIPALHAAAEHAAREHYDLLCALDKPCVLRWPLLPRERRDLLIQTHAALLANLDRPESMDHWSRWLAERVGIACGATAPTWQYSPARDGHETRDLDGGYVDHTESCPACWVLVGAEDCALFYDDPEETTEPSWHRVTGLAGLTDPAAALCAAVIALSPEVTNAR